jgi:L-fuconolactonase
MSIQKIDSHQHFLNPSQINYSWMSPEMPIAKDFLPEHLRPILERNGIDRTILVQAADMEEENTFLLDLTEQHDFIAGVVIWLDMESPRFEERLLHYKKHPKFVGIRPMIESIADDAWMVKPSVRSAFQILQQNDVCFDFLTHPRHLPYVPEILESCPQLRAVIDHISKPRIRDKEFQPWAAQMEQIASYPNVFCKLSGMITEADHKNWKPADLEPYVSHILRIFGSERLMFGSDWPVCLLAGSYDQVLDALRQNLLDQDTQQTENIFGETARRFYRV